MGALDVVGLARFGFFDKEAEKLAARLGHILVVSFATCGRDQPKYDVAQFQVEEKYAVWG